MTNSLIGGSDSVEMLDLTKGEPSRLEILTITLCSSVAILLVRLFGVENRHLVASIVDGPVKIGNDQGLGRLPVPG
jgi:hypothetical protein